MLRTGLAAVLTVIELEDSVADDPRSALRVQHKRLRELQRVVLSNFDVARAEHEDGAVHHGLAVARRGRRRKLHLIHACAILSRFHIARLQARTRRQPQDEPRQHEQDDHFGRDGAMMEGELWRSQGSARTTR